MTDKKEIVVVVLAAVLSKLKLSQLNKDSFGSRHLNRLQGGNLCYWSEENRDANSEAGVCSCACDHSGYYGDLGINYAAEFYKHTTAWGYC